MTFPPAETELQRAYFEALGRFVYEFARVEHMLRMALMVKSGVKQKVARAIFNGLHIDGLTGNIKRILQVTDCSEKEANDISEVFTQLNAVNDVRNTILHQETVFTSGTPIVTNRMTARTAASRKEFSVTVEVLGLMTSDLEKVRAHLMCHVYWKGEIPGYPPTKRWVEPLVARAWLYKRPPQQNTHPQSRAKLQSPPHQR